jgi:Putative phage tail protein
VVAAYASDEVLVKLPGVDDGSVALRESVIALPGITRASQALREAIERLNKLTLGDLDLQWTALDEALALSVGDIVTVTHSIGLAAKAVRITRIVDKGLGRYDITATEYDPAVYSDHVTITPSSADTNLGSPFGTPDAPSGLAYTQTLVNGAPFIDLTWNPPALLPSFYRVTLTAGLDSVYSSTTVTPAVRQLVLPAGVALTASVCSVSFYGAESERIALTFNVHIPTGGGSAEVNLGGN